jgi:hypothetical protein
MPQKNRILIIAIPLLVLLVCLTAYEYGYRRVEAEMTVAQEKGYVKQKTLEKYVSTIAKKSQLEAYLIELKEKRKAENTKVIEGQTPSIAAASLQNTVKTMITARGGTISSNSVEKPEDLQKFKMIGVTVDAVFPDIRALCDTLIAIEAQVPYLAVREMDLRIMNYKDPKDLAVKLKISAITEGK